MFNRCALGRKVRIVTIWMVAKYIFIVHEQKADRDARDAD